MKVEGYRQSGISTRSLFKGTLYIVIGTIIFTLMALWLFDLRAQDIRISGRESTSQIMADGISIAVQEDVISRNFAQLESRLRQSMADPQVLSIIVTDSDGVVLSQVERDTRSGELKPIYSYRKIATPSIDSSVVSDNSVTSRWLELKAGVPIGWLRLETTSTLIDDKLIGLRREVTISLVIACLILFVSIGMLAKRTYGLIRIEEAVMKGKSEMLEEIAFHDHLTGLPNRLLLMDRIGQSIAHSDRSGKKFALCFVDLNGFKFINDTYGHDSGDIVLKEVASRLNECVRLTDTVARIGGDEFVLILLDGEKSEDFEVLLNRITASINHPMQLPSGTEIGVGLSIGMTVYPTDPGSPAELLKHADEAMYQVKKNGSKRFAIYGA